MFLGHKTHSTIFALATGTPLIGLAYHPKTIEFLNQFDLSDNVINDKDLTIEKLIAIFNRLNNNLEEVSISEYSKSKEIASKIFDDLQMVIKDGINQIK